tara:strand:- start:219 stop:818 length:600 start_codon:yes stop_codon:yes gene_type:complete
MSTAAAQESEVSAEQGRLALPLTIDTSISGISSGQPGLEPEEIDRAVLNRLMQEIASAPRRTSSITGLKEETLKNIFISLSNARNFINVDEMRNVKAMCDTWNHSDFQTSARIREALEAYAEKRQHTLTVVEGFYRNVLTEIESLLNAAEKPRFAHYMDDRRRRMADAGISSRNMNPDDLAHGAEAIHFYCRSSRPYRG